MAATDVDVFSVSKCFIQSLERVKGVSAAAEEPGGDRWKCVRVLAGYEAKPPPLRCGGSAVMVEVVSAMGTGVFYSRAHSCFWTMDHGWIRRWNTLHYNIVHTDSLILQKKHRNPNILHDLCNLDMQERSSWCTGTRHAPKMLFQTTMLSCT